MSPKRMDEFGKALQASLERQARRKSAEMSDRADPMSEHHPTEEWVGYPVLVCSGCGAAWPHDRTGR